MYQRIPEYDFAKGILIILMVMFHLGAFHEHYPAILTEFVYSFHMSGFLLLSGFLFNVDKTIPDFLRALRPLVVSYLIFEIAYLCGIGVLGKIVGSSNVFNLTFFNAINSILFHPSGTYWYLHTMIICMLIYYSINSLLDKLLSKFDSLLLSGLILFFLSMIIDGLKFDNVMYFCLGAIIRKSTSLLTEVICPSFVSLLCIVAIVLMSSSFSRDSLTGVALTAFVLSFLFKCNKIFGDRISRAVQYIGRNSLSVVLFSPILAIATKLFLPFFSFDTTVILWMVFSVIFICTVSIGSINILDKILISKCLFGKNMYSQF